MSKYESILAYKVMQYIIRIGEGNQEISWNVHTPLDGHRLYMNANLHARKKCIPMCVRVCVYTYDRSA